MLLSLAVSTAATEPPRSGHEVAAPAGVTAPIAEPLEGPFSFGERSWLRALHENAEAAETIGARVFVTSGGRYYLRHRPTDRVSWRREATMISRRASPIAPPYATQP